MNGSGEQPPTSEPIRKPPPRPSLTEEAREKGGSPDRPLEALAGQVAVVTGGGRGIGSAICRALAQHGARVVVNYLHSEEGAREVVRAIEADGARALAIRADVSRADEVAGLIAGALQGFGRIDILVNNAAIFLRTPFLQIQEADWDRILEINLKGVFLCSQAAARPMLQQGSGRIINLASLGGIKPWPDHLPYCVSKAGVIMATRCLALALAPQIQVNGIAPGLIGAPAGFRSEAVERMVERTPMGRLGHPLEVAELVVFLASSSNFVTGQVITVDGGLGLR
ncbi:MAG: 3-oxoacyl-ACP reductase FabG [Candidatus Tectomicrobia bacterium]|uniref:3-oxoacyl-ACP reductase FabG n=1 Tax=Tectimicrobiota bacterium TaxID=2528274 RepID=A0A932CN05_UNCTE|nr:3-oxoacyl-ACP reductase FabG [Candidatus Tectomicrobia bacterium]